MGGTSSTLEKSYQTLEGNIKARKGMEYGNHFCAQNDERIPVFMQTFKLSEEVYQYLSSLPMFTCEEKDIQSHSYFPCVDYPQLTDHKYYEGYFHSQPTSKPVKSLHPRKGHEYLKPAAPLPLRAYFHCFRQINSEWSNDLKNKLIKLAENIRAEEKKLQPPNGSSKNEKKDEDELEKKAEEDELENATDLILRLISTDCLFGDLAIQFHFGQRVGDDDLGWHSDASNSILHMATAIHGKRALHSHRCKKITAKDTVDIVEWQNPGDIYLSSPTFFMHSVEYPENPTWDTRIIAIQARFLVTSFDYNRIRGTRFQGGIPWRMLLSLVTLSLSEAKFIVPTLEQIKKMEEELKEIEKQEILQSSTVSSSTSSSDSTTTTTTTTTTTSSTNSSSESVGNLYEN